MKIQAVLIQTGNLNLENNKSRRWRLNGGDVAEKNIIAKYFTLYYSQQVDENKEDEKENRKRPKRCFNEEEGPKRCPGTIYHCHDR